MNSFSRMTRQELIAFRDGALLRRDRATVEFQRASNEYEEACRALYVSSKTDWDRKNRARSDVGFQ